MIHGSYKHNIDWEKFKSPGVFELLARQVLNYYGTSYKTCGSGALSILTGLSPQAVDKKLPKRNGHWSDLSAIKFLRNRGFTVVQLTKCGVTNLNGETGEWQNMPITNDHVLLCNMLMCRNEGSWWVINNNYSFHNFEKHPLTPLLFLNKPPQNVYLVTKPSWKRILSQSPWL